MPDRPDDTSEGVRFGNSTGLGASPGDMPTRRRGAPEFGRHGLDDDNDQSDQNDADDNGDDENGDSDENRSSSVTVDGVTYKYPPNTAVADMTDSQKAEYYRQHSRKWEKQAKRNKRDLDAARKKSTTVEVDDEDDDEDDDRDTRRRSDDRKDDRSRRRSRTQRTDPEALREQIRREVMDGQNSKYVNTLMTAELKGAGWEADRIESHIEHLNLASFVDEDGEIDTDAITNHVTAVAPRKKRSPDYGRFQGGKGPMTKSDYLRGMEDAKSRVQ